MTVPMIINKINSYDKRLSIVKKRLTANFYRTIGDSIMPSSNEEGKQIIGSALWKKEI